MAGGTQSATSLADQGKFPALLALPGKGGFLAAYERGDAIVIRHLGSE